MPTKKAPSRLGIGLYSIPEAARIVGVQATKIRRWVSPKEGLIPRLFNPSEGTVSFLELMELHFINMFRSEGVSLQTIRKAVDAASRKFHSDYPFAVRRFDTDGRTIFATLLREESDEIIIEDLRRGQYVFGQIMRPFFRKLEYRAEDEAMRYWPLERKGRIVLDPERRFGSPIDAETGVPTKALHQAAKTEQDLAIVADWFDVPIRAVESAVRFEESLAA